MDLSELKRIKSTASFQRHPWELARRKIIHALLIKSKPLHETIIDFGSGDTFLLHYLESQNTAKKYYAVDNAYTQELVTAIRNLYGTSAIEYEHGVTDIDKKELPADCLLLLDVIEHCENDLAILQSATAETVMAKNATIFITVPAYQSFFSGHDRLLLHYRRYSLQQLTRLCEQSGLHITAKGYFFFSLLIARMCQVLLEKAGLRKPSTSLDNWTGSKPVTKMIAALLWIDFKIGYFLSKTGIRIPGLSCYCIGAKQ